MDRNFESIIIGGGQSGLSVAYFLRRFKIKYLILDQEKESGGSWLHTWDSLKLFSPTEYSSLSGWQMPKSTEEYPSKNELLKYLKAYEERYKFPILRETKVVRVAKTEMGFRIETNKGNFFCKTLISATGTAQNYFIPKYKHYDKFKGIKMHSVDYRNSNPFKSKKVILVGSGNSGAQILSEISKVAETKWISIRKPVFLPEGIDGRDLFNQANANYHQTGNKISISLADIVQVESVRDGVRRNIYHDYKPFDAFYEDGVVWKNGQKEHFDAVIWCTGFKANLKHLTDLNLEKDGRIETKLTHCAQEPALWLVGYGNWTGYASATLYGVGKTAKQTATELINYLNEQKNPNSGSFDKIQ